MRTIDVEWRHLEINGAICDRCGDTGTLPDLRRGALYRVAGCC